MFGLKSGAAAIALTLLTATPALAQMHDMHGGMTGKHMQMSRADMRMMDRCHRMSHRMMMRNHSCQRLMAMQKHMDRGMDDHHDGMRDHHKM